MLIDTLKKERHTKQNISENKLQELIVENFGIIFPELKLIKVENTIRGDVRQFGINGRIDILAFNPKNYAFVIFELKKKHSKNILFQVYDYVDFIEENLEIVVSRIKNLTPKEKQRILEKREKPKIILIANEFLHPTIRRVKRLEDNIILYEYNYYSNGSFRINRLTTDEKYSRKIKNIPINNEHKDNIFPIVKDILENVIIEDKYYKIESNRLIINPTKLFNSYQDYYKESQIIPLSKTDFFTSLKMSTEFIEYKKNIRFNNNSTSAMIFRI